MDADIADEVGEFHTMDASLVPYQEDPKVIMLRDWPPAYSVHLRYKPNGRYLGVKKGSLTLTSNPYVLSSNSFVQNCPQEVAKVLF